MAYRAGYCLLVPDGMRAIFDTGKKKRGPQKASLFAFQGVTDIRTVLPGLMAGNTGLMPGRQNRLLKAQERFFRTFRRHIVLIV